MSTTATIVLPDEILTSVQFARNLAPAELERIGAIFQFLAVNSYELRTANGLRLNDATDWRQFFREVAGELAERQKKAS